MRIDERDLRRIARELEAVRTILPRTGEWLGRCITPMPGIARGTIDTNLEGGVQTTRSSGATW